MTLQEFYESNEPSHCWRCDNGDEERVVLYYDGYPSFIWKNDNKSEIDFHSFHTQEGFMLNGEIKWIDDISDVSTERIDYVISALQWYALDVFIPEETEQTK